MSKLELVKRQWPTKEQEQLYFELNQAKDKPRGPGRKGIKQPDFPFAMLESIPAAQLDKLLTAASFQLKRVKRFPGWILVRTYNLKNRPIEFI